jgi:hypothetical protein
MPSIGFALCRNVSLLVAISLCPNNLFAQALPPSDELHQIILQLNEDDAGVTVSVKPSKEFQLRGLRYEAGSRTDEVCNMQHFSMVLTNDRTGKSNTFSVLLDRQANSNAIVPQQLFALTKVLHVDADGSPRAYHPLDPNGKGVCRFTRKEKGRYAAEGVCALDVFSSGGIKVFSGATKLAGDELERKWKPFWLQINNHKVAAADLNNLSVERAKQDYYLFHSKERDLTALFKRAIIPSTNAGHPCTFAEAAPFPGYFVAATALTHNADQDIAEGNGAAEIAPSECKPARYLNAELVPFFVLPGGKVGNARVGDIVIAYAEIGGEERTVYGVVGDGGPTQSFGEGSIALIQSLLGKHDEPVMNNASLNALDIGPDSKITVGILILGGTKELLNGNYRRENLEAIGRQELARWGEKSPNPSWRLKSCYAQAKANPR